MNKLRLLPGTRISPSIKWAWAYVFVVMIFALIGPYVANEKPYVCRIDNETYFPAFSGISESTLSSLHPSYAPVEWRSSSFDFIWHALIPYSHFTIDLKTGSHVSPFDKQALSLRFRHWLGTDALGRDVLAGMIRGCRVSLLIGLGSMILALLIGVPLGSAGAYWGNSQLKASLLQMFIGACMIMLMIYTLWLFIGTLTTLLLILFFLLIWFLLNRLMVNIRSKKYALPVDSFIMSLISIIDSFPGLFIMLIIHFIIPVKGWVVVLGVIALLRWPVMARYMRAEVYKMKESNFIKAAQIINLPDLYILRKHIIPYAFRPVMISFIFGVSTAILAESSLSFLGIGLPADEVNWGRLLSQSRQHFDSWWLVLFPGMAIFFTLLSLYTIGNAAQKEQIAGAIEQGAGSKEQKLEVRS